MNRKEFIRLAAPGFLLLGNGRLVKTHGYFSARENKKIKLRFAVASDGHYGQPETDYDNFFLTAVSAINDAHSANPFSFCMINGDIIHDDKSFYPAAKMSLDNLHMKYYVSQGNHDHVTADEWQTIWNMPVNYDFTIESNSFLIATTSDEKGTYLCPDLEWFEKKLAAHKEQKNVFIFIHINPGRQTKNAVDCPGFFDVLRKYNNVRGIFNGHDHDEEGIKIKNNIPFIFDAHFGGNWGTAYRGYRIVEVLKDNSVHTYIMNPVQKINEEHWDTSMRKMDQWKQ